MSIETINNKRKRLIFRSWHRGMKEMDQIMGSFANDYVPNYSPEQLDLFEQVLQNSDPDLYDWIFRRVDVPANKANPILDELLKYDYAKKRSRGSDEAKF